MRQMTSEEINRIIGRNIRRVRWASKQLNTLVTLSAQLKLSWQQFQKYETGKNRISLVTAVETANALGVPIEAFCTDLGLPQGPHAPITPEEQALLESYRELHDVAKRRVLATVEQLAHLGKGSHAA